MRFGGAVKGSLNIVYFTHVDSETYEFTTPELVIGANITQSGGKDE
jgi:hypothetical protein